MPKSVFGEANRRLVAVLAAARHRAGLTQSQLARRVGKDQSFISIIENSQRRVDVLEFCALARAMDMDAAELFAEVLASLPSSFLI